MSTSAQQKNYFNLHTSGIGYLNDIRKVEPKKGNAFVACRIAALVGDSDNTEYRYFDMNVVGEEAEKLILRCQEAVDAKKKVLISFVMYDTFVYNKDSGNHKKGDTGVSLKGRLIRINLIKVNGEEKYRAKSENTEERQQTEAKSGDIENQ